MPFKNRAAAGRRLAATLARYKSEQPIVLAIPRGGVPVAAEVSEALGAPLDLVAVRKLSAPSRPELAMGAVVDGMTPRIVRNEQVIRDVQIDAEEFAAICARELGELELLSARYARSRPRVEIRGRTVIVVDDGVSTGATARAALEALSSCNPRRLVLAVPVMAPDAEAAVSFAADDIVCLEQPDPFESVGAYYADFTEVTDEEVAAILRDFTPEVEADQPLARLA